jgi:hypothetical protein
MYCVEEGEAQGGRVTQIPDVLISFICICEWAIQSLESFDCVRAVKAQNPINGIQESAERPKCQAPSPSDLPDLGKLG